MNWIGRLLRRGRVEDQLDAELRDHFDRLVSDYIGEGLNAQEARRKARLEFGGFDQVKELCRDARGTRWFEDLVQDIRYGLRGLQRNRGFTIIAVLTLALGIGANAAVFSVINALLLRSLPVRDPSELVTINRRQGSQVGGHFSYPQIRELADHKEIFRVLCAFGTDRVNVGPAEAMEPAIAQWVSGSYFDTLGLAPQAGRLLTTADDEPGAPPAVVISDGYWTRHLSRDAQIVGKTILIEGVASPIVGVSPPGFVGATVGEASDLTLAIQSRVRVRPDQTFFMGPGTRWLRTLARIQPGLSPEQAQAKAEVAWHQMLEASLPATMAADARSRALSGTIDIVSGRTGTSVMRQQWRLPLQIALGFVVLVLLIACVNVANLLLARGTTRQREIAVRLSIGAGRARIVRQLLTESALIAISGALAGLAVAWFGGHALLDLMASGKQGPDGSALILDLSPDWLMFAVTVLVVVATTLVFGAAPAWRGSQVHPGAAMGAAGRVSESHGRLGSSLVAAQVALSLVLVIGAGLFARTLYNLRTLDRGFGIESVLLVAVDAGRAGYKPPQAIALTDELLAFAERLPGVRAASVASITPLEGGGISQSIAVNGVSTGQEEVHFNLIGSRYFDVMRTPIIAGRDFSRSEPPTGPFVAIVNEAFVRRYMTNSPLGQRVSVIGGTAREMEIVGVVKDAAYDSLRDAPPPTVYAALHQRPNQATLVIHAPGATADVASAIRTEVQSRLGGRSPKIGTLSEQLETSLALEKLLARVTTVFGLLALTLAAIGLYGLTSYWVTSRTREIGVRVALGAKAGQVPRLILGDTIRMVVIGIAVGTIGAAGLSRLIAKMVYGLSPTDVATVAFSIALLLITGTLAGFVPARRATRIDPHLALRNE